MSIVVQTRKRPFGERLQNFLKPLDAAPMRNVTGGRRGASPTVPMDLRCKPPKTSTASNQNGPFLRSACAEYN
jgi:hypothetical protein